MTQLILLAMFAVAPVRDTSVLVLDEVVVTAERVRHAVRDVAASVSVVSGVDIERSGARTATDALAQLPGVFVQRTGQFGRTDIDIRGVGDRGCRIAVLVDGRPEKMPIYGCVVTHTLPAHNVERIELVRGPLSVLYGSDAMAGVVNIITRRAGRPLDLSARMEYGSFGTMHGRLTAGTRQQNWHLLFSADKAMSSGHLPNSQYNGNDVSICAGLGLSSKLDLDFTGKFFSGIKHEPRRSTDPETLVATGWNQYDRGGLDLTATIAGTPVQGFAKVYRTFGEHEFDPKDCWHSTDYTNGAVLHARRDFAFGNLLQAGVEAKNMSGTWMKSDTNKPSWSRNQVGFFAQDEQRFGPVSANAGVRYEYDDISGGIVAPKAGVVLRLPGRASLRASLNRGFRFAPLNYTSVFPPKNPDLKPEVTWNYEVGAAWEVVPGFAFDFAGYMLDGENLIETGPNPNPPPPVQFQNKGRFRFKGIETGLTARSGWFRGTLAATLADYGVNTRARPGLKLDGTVGAELNRVTAEIAGHGVGRYFAADSSQSPIPAYATLDFRAGYRLLNWLRVSGRIENVFDARYDAFADLPGAGAGLYRQPGRSFTLALDFEN